MDAGPLAIGGVGGSGTRVVAQIAVRLGVHMGDNVNKYYDNLDFPGLDRILEISAAPIHPVLQAEEVARFASAMEVGLRRHPECRAGWGWKNPPTHLYLEQFHRYFPTMRYVHVIRHGLDVALSDNVRQVRQWGHLFGVTYGNPTRVRSALRYWIRANDAAIERGRALLGERFLLIRFDELCRAPVATVRPLAAMLGLDCTDAEIEAAIDVVVPPATIGRSARWYNRRRFEPDDLREVERFGFDVEHR